MISKYIVMAAAVLLSAPQSFAGFDFGQCSGEGTFQQEITRHTNHDDDILVGTIPQGIQGLKITLKSTEDVDIRLYAQNDDKIIHWPKGLLNKSYLETKPYRDMMVTYSGYNGENSQRGHEFIEVNGTTPMALRMTAFGYNAGYATVKYSWTGKEGCENNGSAGMGHFIQDIPNKAIALVGEIPKEIHNLEVNLTSTEDIDIQLYGEDGTAIVRWSPKQEDMGLLHSGRVAAIDYHGMHIEWSGYNGVDGHTGHEYIKVTPKTTEKLTMKVFGYESGTAEVTYSWDTNTVESRDIFSYGENILDSEFLTESKNIALLTNNKLNIITAEGTSISTLSLPYQSAKMAINVAANRLAISADSRVMLIDISDLAHLHIVRTYTVPAKLGEIAIHKDYIYTIESHNQWSDLYSIPMNGEAYSKIGYASYGTNITFIMNHEQDSLYVMDSGVSPQDIDKFDLSNGEAKSLYDSPYHGDYDFCSNMWTLSDTLMATACGTTLTMDKNKTSDMLYDGLFHSSNLKFNTYNRPITMIRSIDLNKAEEKFVVAIGDKTFRYEINNNDHQNIIEIYAQNDFEKISEKSLNKIYTEENKEYVLFVENAYMLSDQKVLIRYKAILKNDTSKTKVFFETISI